MSCWRIPVLVAAVAVQAAPVPALGQRLAAQAAKPAVEIVRTVGCVERRAGDPEWWLARAAEPAVTRAGVFNSVQVDEARAQAPGEREFALVGVADFLGAEALLRSFDRASFTTPEQVNATGELRAGRTVLVKGLLIEADEGARINLLAVVGLAETCGEQESLEK